ncbi:MAG: carnitine dehydratase [Proteobacteria bacterium]|nr:MAG: carnitine dehydratase [Pseudomonadota bacterium]
MLFDALHELLLLAGLDASEEDRVEIRGEDPVLPTRFRIGIAASSAVAACGIAAAKLWGQRGGRDQSITVDNRHAVASLRSARYLRVNGAPLKDPVDKLSGLYETHGQRWIYLHCNFLNHRVAALTVLGLPHDAARDRVAEAVRGRDGSSLEDAIHAAGGCAGLVRDTEEWLRHPQSAAVAALPLLEIDRIGDADPEPLSSADRPLTGVRVLDLTRVLAGPTCARTLAEHGADVLKVSGPHLPHSGDVEVDTGLGKLSTFLDLRQQSDADTLISLVRDGRCDVFSQSYRPGTLAARGLGGEALARLRPGIVYVELTAWGREGPWARRRGFDTVVQCVSGMAKIQGGEGRPVTMPVSAIDYVSGYIMAFGAMVALSRRAVEGGSWRVRVSLARTGRWIVDRGLLDNTALLHVPKELSEEQITSLTQETPSLLGLVRHLRPVPQLSITSPRWERPPSPLGSDPPRWPSSRE